MSKGVGSEEDFRQARQLVRAYGPEKLLAELQAAGAAAGARPAPAGGPFARLVAESGRFRAERSCVR